MEGEDKLKEDEEFDEFSGYSLFELDYEERWLVSAWVERIKMMSNYDSQAHLR